MILFLNHQAACPQALAPSPHLFLHLCPPRSEAKASTMVFEPIGTSSPIHNKSPGPEARGTIDYMVSLHLVRGWMLEDLEWLSKKMVGKCRRVRGTHRQKTVMVNPAWDLSFMNLGRSSGKVPILSPGTVHTRTGTPCTEPQSLHQKSHDLGGR